VISLALALVLFATPPCDDPRISALEEHQWAAACELLAKPAPNGQQNLDALKSIFEREGFEQARQRNSGALAAFLAQVRAWLERLFATSGAETYSNLTRIGVLALALIVGITIVARVIRRQRARPAPESKAKLATSLQLDEPAVHRQRATALIEADPRAAIREGWLAVLSSLEQHRYARPDRVKTNRELVAELPTRGAPSELVASVSQLVTWFDRTFYSLDPVASEQARQFLADVDRVLT